MGLGHAYLSVGDHLRQLAAHDKEWPDEAYGGLTKEDIRNALGAHDLIAPQNIAAIVSHQVDHHKASGDRVLIIEGFAKSEEATYLFEQLVSFAFLAIASWHIY